MHADSRLSAVLHAGVPSTTSLVLGRDGRIFDARNAQQVAPTGAIGDSHSPHLAHHTCNVHLPGANATLPKRYTDDTKLEEKSSQGQQRHQIELVSARSQTVTATRRRRPRQKPNVFVPVMYDR